MRRATLLVSAAAFFLAGAAVAQNAGAPNTPAAAASSAAGLPTLQLPAAQGGVQSQSGPPSGQQVSEAACNADAQKFCSGKQGTERLQCLTENKANLTAACRATIEEPRN